MSSSLPLVSIISINYNQLHHTCAMIESLRKISYPNIEVIIVDNASSESPKEKIQKDYPEAILVLSDKNLGFAGGNNLGIEKSANTFMLAAAMSAALGLFSFILPNTPPKGKSEVVTGAQAIGADAFVLFRNRPYLVFFIAAILVCIPLSFYYGFANPFLNEIGMTNAAGKMILGQVSEGVFILAIPFLFNRIGVKNMLILGILAWILRYVFFAYGYGDPNSWMLYGGIILHGVCYDFFFVTGYMYTEKKAGEKIKNAAQGLFTFATYGLGMFIGTWFSGFVANHYQTDGGHNWQAIWMVPAGIATLVLVYFLVFFKEKKEIAPAAV